VKAEGTEKFRALLRESILGGTLVKLTLGKPAGADPTLVNLFVRPVQLKSGPRLAFVWRHATRDVTKNHGPEEALGILEPLVGAGFLDAHLFTSALSAQLETGDGRERLRVTPGGRAPAEAAGNDRVKRRPIAPGAPWLRALGVTDTRGRPLAPMTDKFRQIERYAEILGHLLSEATFPATDRLRVFDMGCGKGYLTFAASELLGDSAHVCGIESRGDLVDLCNKVAEDEGIARRISFRQGSIASIDTGQADVLIALHACDTATDDALAKGILSGASLILAAPCCQKELRPRIEVPPVLAPALKHGIFAERQAEFVTDALRAQLLEWAGYRTKVMEFISTEHTAKNTLITAVKARPPGGPAEGATIREFAAFYGVRRQALADHLGFALT
jgi:hypothetical protein